MGVFLTRLQYPPTNQENTMKRLVLIGFFLLQGSPYIPVHAQWTSDTTQNSGIGVLSGEQTLPKTALTSDGGCYISWFDNRNGGYAVYLQRLNVLGVPQWPSNGMLVSDHAQNSSLVDYDLTIDLNDNAVVVFTDIRSGNLNPFAYKISPEGSFLWGADGIMLTDSMTYYQPNPKVVTTSDGGSVILWIYASTPRKIAIQKYDAMGVPQWGETPIKLSSGTSENYDWPSLVSSDSGSTILFWCGYTGTFINPSGYKLYTQKFSSSGVSVWNADRDTVYSLGRVSGFYTPRIFSDGVNGAVFCWRDDRNSDNLQSAYVQRFDVNGSAQFPVNGAECSTFGSDNHFDPIASYDTSNGTTYAFWMEANAGQTMAGGLYGQRFSSNGTRLWPESGAVIKPMDNNTFSGLSVFARQNSVIVHFNESQFGSANNVIKAFALDSAGGFLWSGHVQVVGASSGEKIHLNSRVSGSGVSILSWGDRRADGGDIYAQNITADGHYGNLVSIDGAKEPARFRLIGNFPNPFNPSTTIAFDLPRNNFVGLTLHNTLGQIVRTLFKGIAHEGRNEIDWDGRDDLGRAVSSGIYLYRLQMDGMSVTKKMILSK